MNNKDAVFKFDLQGIITIVRRDSGTGKTTLFDMIADYIRLHMMRCGIGQIHAYESETPTKTAYLRAVALRKF